MEISLYERWRVAVENQANGDQSARQYLWVDAAQLPANAMPWKDLVAHGAASNVLWNQPEGGNPEVCCLLFDLREPWIGDLVERHLARRPFAFSVLTTSWGRTKLQKALNRRCAVRLPNGKPGLLRFYDTAVLGALIQQLDARQISDWLGVASSWLFVDRSGDMVMNLSEQLGHDVLGQPALSGAQLAALDRAGTVDRLIAALVANQWLPVNFAPFTTYENTSRLVELLKSYNFVEEPVWYQILALLADDLGAAARSEQFEAIVKASDHYAGRLLTAVAEHAGTFKLNEETA